MSERKVNLEEILDSQKMAISKMYLQGAVRMGKPVGNDYQKILNAMKEAIRQSLELAAENVDHLWDERTDTELFDIDKQSILNTINQIE